MVYHLDLNLHLHILHCVSGAILLVSDTCHVTWIKEAGVGRWQQPTFSAICNTNPSVNISYTSGEDRLVENNFNMSLNWSLLSCFISVNIPIMMSPFVSVAFLTLSLDSFVSSLPMSGYGQRGKNVLANKIQTNFDVFLNQFRWRTDPLKWTTEIWILTVLIFSPSYQISKSDIHKYFVKTFIPLFSRW